MVGIDAGEGVSALSCGRVISSVVESPLGEGSKLIGVPCVVEEADTAPGAGDCFGDLVCWRAARCWRSIARTSAMMESGVDRQMSGGLGMGPGSGLLFLLFGQI